MRTGQGLEGIQTHIPTAFWLSVIWCRASVSPVFRSLVSLYVHGLHSSALGWRMGGGGDAARRVVLAILQPQTAIVDGGGGGTHLS